MAEFDEPLPVKVQIDVGGWTDVVLDTLSRQDISIQRGKRGEGSRVDAASCAMQWDNSSGDYSERNPLGAHYGLLTRNTPVRAGIERPETWLQTSYVVDNGVTTTDKATLDIVGDIDVRFEADLPDWRLGVDWIGKWTSAGNQRSWLLGVENGRLLWLWSTDGTAISSAASTVPPPSSGRYAVRVTHDVNNGASGNTVTFYVSDSISGSWTQLGDPVVTAGTTSIFSSTAIVSIGDASGFPTYGRIYAAEIRSSIGGTVVANPTFTSQTAGATSFADTAGTPNTWTVTTGGDLRDVDYRFHGECSELPPRWDLSENDAYVPVVAAGPLRRLGQGNNPLGSTMYRGLTGAGAANPPIAYWPCEDGEGATHVASGLPGGAPMKVSISQPDFATYDGFKCSRPLPAVQQSQWYGVVPQYTPTGEAQARFLFHIDTGVNSQRIFTVYCSGTIQRFGLFYGTGGTFNLIAYDTDGTNVAETGAGTIGGSMDGRLLRVSIEMEQNGSDIDFGVVPIDVGAGSSGSLGATASGHTLGRITGVGTNAGGGITTGDNRAHYGHISVHTLKSTVFDMTGPLDAWNGERAGARVQRLCGEEGVEFRPLGDVGTTEQMGPQLPAKLLDLLHQCQDVDLGTLAEGIDFLGLTYRPRPGNLVPRVALDHGTDNALAAPLAPTPDDQQLRNDWLVSREGGSSARAYKESGPMSVQPPPAGVGRYDDQVTLTAYSDDRLGDLAGFKVQLGTIDEDRYPSLSIERNTNPVLADPAISAGLLGLQLGDRVLVTDPPAGGPPDDVSQLVIGWSETIRQKQHRFDLVTVPESPWRVPVADDAVLGRAAPVGSTLNEDLDTTETAVDVATVADKPPWVTDAGEFPFNITVGGEVMTITAISGASSPQTFTVVRSVNGVVKSHSTGAEVRLTQAMYAAL